MRGLTLRLDVPLERVEDAFGEGRERREGENTRSQEPTLPSAAPCLAVARSQGGMCLARAAMSSGCVHHHSRCARVPGALPHSGHKQDSARPAA